MTEFNQEQWLPLSKAAERVGVHASTLRRWADSGYVRYVTTAGGHRRFSERDIAALTERQSQRHVVSQDWAARALTHARSEVAHENAGGDAHWLQSLDASARDAHRAVGRKLMGLTLQFVSSDDERPELLAEAGEVGREYGRLSRDTGVTLRDALAAALFFRDRLLEATWELPVAARSQSGQDNRLERRINTLLNTVQLAIAEIYEVGA